MSPGLPDVPWEWEFSPGAGRGTPGLEEVISVNAHSNYMTKLNSVGWGGGRGWGCLLLAAVHSEAARQVWSRNVE